MSFPDELRPCIKYYNYSKKVSDESAKVVLVNFFVNLARDILEENGNSNQEAIDFVDNIANSVREFQEEDITNYRNYVNKLYSNMSARVKSGARMSNMIPTMLMISNLYSIFEDDEVSAAREEECKKCAAMIKHYIDQNGECGPQTQISAEQPSAPPPQPSTPYVPPQEPVNPYVPPKEPVNPYQPPAPAPEPKPTPPPADPKPPAPKPAPKPADPPAPKPAPAPKPSGEPCASVANCKYNRDPALAYFEQEGIKLVSKCLPAPDIETGKCIQRYIDYAVSRLYADMYTESYKFLENALKSWKVGKPV